MSEKDTENFIVGGGVLQRNHDGSFTEVESFNMNIGMNSYDKKESQDTGTARICQRNYRLCENTSI